MRSFLVLLLVISGARLVVAAEPSDLSPDADRNAPKLFVPYKDVPALIGPLDRAVLLQREEFTKLLAAAEGARGADDQRDVAQITRGDYQASVEGEKLKFTGTLEIVSLADQPVAVPLKFGQVGLTTVTLDAKDAPLGYDRTGRLVVIVTTRGPHKLAVAGSAVLKDLAGGGVQFGMSVPTAVAGAMAFAAPGDLEVHATVPVSASTYDKAADKTNVTLTLGGHETLNVVLMGNGRQEDQRAILLGTSATTVQLTEAYQTLNCLYTVQVLRRGVRELTFALPGAWTITDVDCPALVNWSVVPGPKLGTGTESANGMPIRSQSPVSDQQLVVRLRTASRGAKAVHIQAGASRSPGAAWVSPYVKLVGADFQHGHLLVDTGRDIAVRGQQLDRARREDLSAANFVPGLLAATQGRLFYHWSDTWSVRLDLAGVALRTSAEVRHTAIISPEELSLTSQFDITAIGRELFDLTLDLPSGETGARWQVSGVSIDGADAGSQYREVQAADGPPAAAGVASKRAIKIALSRPVRPEGVTHVVLMLRSVPADWQWPAGAAPRDVDLPVPGIVADTVSGLLAVAPVGDLDAEALTAPPAMKPVTVGRMASLGLSGEVQLAYTYETPIAAPLRVHVQRRSPRLAADSIGLVTAQPTHLEGLWRIHYNISRARERKLYLLADKALGQALTITAVGHQLAGKDRVPPGKDTVELSAALAGAYDLWQLTLDSQAAGDVAVDVRYDRPLTGPSVTVPLVRPIAAAQINEMLAIQASEELAVTVTAAGASDVDAVDLPPLPAPASRLLRAFRIDAPTTDAGAAAAIRLATTVHDKYVIPVALAAEARLTTYLGAAGGQRTEAVFQIVNAGLQFLTIHLPEGAQLWSISVAGQQAKPSLSAAGNYLVAIARSPKPQEVKVVFALPDTGSGDLRRVSLGRADLPGVKINHFQWTVLPPPGYRVAGQFTDMEAQSPFRPQLAGESMLDEIKRLFGAGEFLMDIGSQRVAEEAADDLERAPKGMKARMHHATATGGQRGGKEAGRSGLAEEEKAEEMADQAAAVPAAVLPSADAKPESGAPRVPPPAVTTPAPATQPAQPPQDQGKAVAGKDHYYYRSLGRYTLPVELTASPDAGPRSIFSSLGPSNLEIALASQATGQTSDWIGLAGVLLAGLLLVRRRAGRKTTFIAVVLGLSTLVAIWWPAGAYAANGAFRGAMWLIPAYLVIGIGRWLWGKIVGPAPAVAGRTFAIIILALALGAGLLAGQTAYAGGLPAAAGDPAPAATKGPVPPGKPTAAPAAPAPGDPFTGDAAGRPTPAGEMPLVVPYEGDPQNAEKGDKILVSYARYVELWNLAHPDQLIELAAPPIDVSLAGVRYAATLAGDRMNIVLTAQVRTFSRSWAVLSLPMSGLAVTEATLDGKPAQLQVGPKGMILTLPGHTTGELKITAVTTPKQLGRRGSVTMALPPLPAAVLTLDLPATTGLPDGPADDLDLEAPGVEGALSKAPAAGGVIRWTVPLGIQREVTLKWSPVVGAGAADRTLSAAAAHEVFAFHWALVGVSRITYTFSAGTNERFGLLLPEGVTLTDLTGANLRDFRDAGAKELEGVKYRVVEVRLHRPASKSFELTARWVGKLPPMDAPAALPLPAAADVGRESGTVALYAAGGMSAKINTVVGGRRSAEGAPAAKQAAPVQAAEYVASYYWPYRPFALTVQLSRNVVSPAVRMDQLVRIDRQEVQLLVQAAFSTKTGRIFGASFALPAGLELLSVVGPAVEDHYEQPTPTGRRLHVNFRSGVTSTNIAMVLVRKNPRLEDLTAPAVVAVDADGQELADQSGRLAVQVAASLDAQTLGSENLRPTPPRGMRGWLDLQQTAAVQFAYSYETPKFQLRLKVAPQPTKIRLEVLGGLTVQPTTAWYSYRLRYQIEGTPIDTVRFTLPTRYAALVAVSSPALRSVSKAPVGGSDAAGRTEWTVALVNEVTGTLDVAVNFAVPIDATTTGLDIPRIATPPVQGYRAVVAVQNASPHKLSLMDSAHMTPLPQSEQQQVLAEAVRKNLQFVLQSFTDDWSVVLGVKPVKEAARVEAVVDLMALTTVVDRGGQYRYEARLMLQNRTQQFLRVKVPAGLQLWSAIVADQPVKPVTDPAAGADVILIPLVKTSPGGLPYDVNLYLAGASGQSLGLIGEIRPPAIAVEGVSVQRTIWTLRLPAGYRYYRPGGNLSPASDLELQSVEGDALIDQLRRNDKSMEELSSSGSQRGLEVAKSTRDMLNKKIAYNIRQVQHGLKANPSKLSGKEISRLEQKVADQSNYQSTLQNTWVQREKDQQETNGDNNVNWYLNNDSANGGVAENVRNNYLNTLPAFVRSAAEGQKQEITEEIARNNVLIDFNKAPAAKGKATGKLALPGNKAGGDAYGFGAGKLALDDQQILVDAKDQDKESEVAQVLEKLQQDQLRSQERRQSELKGQLTLLGDNRLERYYGNLANQSNPQAQQGQQAVQQMDQSQTRNNTGLNVNGRNDLGLNVQRQSVHGGNNTNFNPNNLALNGEAVTVVGNNAIAGGVVNQPARQPMQPQGQVQLQQRVLQQHALPNQTLFATSGQSQLEGLDRSGRLVATGRPTGGTQIANGTFGLNSGGGLGGGGGGGTAPNQRAGNAQVVVSDGDAINIAAGQQAANDFGALNVNAGDATVLNRLPFDAGLAVARGTYPLPITLPAGGVQRDFQGPTGSPTVSILAVDERLVDAAHNTGAVLVIALVVWLLGRLMRHRRRRAEAAPGGFLPAYVLLAAVLAALVASGGMGLVGGIVLFGVILCPVELAHRLLSRRVVPAA